MTVDDLEEFGMVRMEEREMRELLSTHNTGVLGLPTEGPPLLRPMSFWFDGDSRIYLPYVLGASSRKKELSDRADVARFLVYRAETPFNWRSVLLTGRLTRVPESDRAEVQDAMTVRWRPDVFERATESGVTELYELEITDRTGIKHVGLPPGFEPPSDDGEN